MIWIIIFAAFFVISFAAAPRAPDRAGRWGNTVIALVASVAVTLWLWAGWHAVRALVFYGSS